MAMAKGNGKEGHVNLAFEDDKKSFEGTSKEKHGNVEDEEAFDPWKLPEVSVKVIPWSDLNMPRKIKRVIWDYFGRVVFIFGFLYLFIVSLDFLSSGFQLLGGKAVGQIFQQNDILSNPVAGVMIGTLVTVLVQSSSTTTAIVITMAAEEILTVRTAIPIVMGANIGTSVTNTIVALGQIRVKEDFRRAFAGATIHDFFNWLSVLVLLPLEVITGYLERLTGAMVATMHLESDIGASRPILKTITKPLGHLIVWVDERVIEGIAGGLLNPSTSLIRYCCTLETHDSFFNRTVNGTIDDSGCKYQCVFLFRYISDYWSNTTIGAIILVFALVLMLSCLLCIVKLLHALLKGKIALVVKKVINAKFPGRLSYFTGYMAILVGAGVTMIIQSSSIFTSSLTPLVGLGIVKLERMYPLTIGANIGTTFTGIMAALAQRSDHLDKAMQVAMCHLFFNISGIIIWYPLPFMRLPVTMAKFLGMTVEKYRWFAIVYLITAFFLFPAAIFGLTIPPWYVGAGVTIPIASVLLVIIIINFLQRKRPKLLPKVLHNWKFLPEPLRSLAPMDRVLSKMVCCKSKHAAREPDAEICDQKPVNDEKNNSTKL